MRVDEDLTKNKIVFLVLIAVFFESSSLFFLIIVGVFLESSSLFFFSPRCCFFLSPRRCFLSPCVFFRLRLIKT